MTFAEQACAVVIYILFLSGLFWYVLWSIQNLFDDDL